MNILEIIGGVAALIGVCISMYVGYQVVETITGLGHLVIWAISLTLGGALLNAIGEAL